jgi:hypothetical protein
VFVPVYPPIVARQRLGRNFTAVTNTHATEKLLDALIPMGASVVCRKVSDQIFPEHLVVVVVVVVCNGIIHLMTLGS